MDFTFRTNQFHKAHFPHYSYHDGCSIIKLHFMCHFISTPTKIFRCVSENDAYTHSGFVFCCFLSLHFDSCNESSFTSRKSTNNIIFAQMQFKLFKHYILCVPPNNQVKSFYFIFSSITHSSDFIGTHDHRMMLKNCFRAFIERAHLPRLLRLFQAEYSTAA